MGLEHVFRIVDALGIFVSAESPSGRILTASSSLSRSVLPRGGSEDVIVDDIPFAQSPPAAPTPTTGPGPSASGLSGGVSTSRASSSPPLPPPVARALSAEASPAASPMEAYLAGDSPPRLPQMCTKGVRGFVPSPAEISSGLALMIYEYSGSKQFNTHLDHTSHCKTAPGTN